MKRTGLDPAAVDEVIFGCLDQLGPQSMNVARTCWLAAGLPETTPGTTIDRQCGSSQQAVSYAAQAVMSGTSDLVVAGGVQNMSAIPIMTSTVAAADLGFPDPFSGSDGWTSRYGDAPVSQFVGAELVADKWGLTREAMEDFAVTSHERALAAQAAGYFDREIAPIAGIAADEGPRRPDRPKMESLRPLAPGGRITAALASQISDGAAALLIASERAVDEHGLTPRARIHHFSARGDDPIMMLSAPIPATAFALERTGMSLAEMDVIEINEAFASVVLAWQAETGADPGQGQPQRGSDRAGPSAGRDRRPVDDVNAARTRAHRRQIRPADDVRSRWSGQRHDHRTALNLLNLPFAPSLGAVASPTFASVYRAVPPESMAQATTTMFISVQLAASVGVSLVGLLVDRLHDAAFPVLFWVLAGAAAAMLALSGLLPGRPDPT